MYINNVSHIFILGHRKQHGKDTSCDLLENYFKRKNISYCRTFFAKHLKLEVAEKYNLDINLMESDEYKSSRPKHLNGKSVREILIEYGNKEKEKYKDVWSYKAYKEIMDSGKSVGIISDFRFPNEYDSFNEIYAKYRTENYPTEKFIPELCPKLHKILIHKPDGFFVSDGADDQIPDVDENFWHHIVYNDSKKLMWKKRIEEQLFPYIEKAINEG